MHRNLHRHAVFFDDRRKVILQQLLALLKGELVRQGENDLGCYPSVGARFRPLGVVPKPPDVLRPRHCIFAGKNKGFLNAAARPVIRIGSSNLVEQLDRL